MAFIKLSCHVQYVIILAEPASAFVQSGVTLPWLCFIMPLCALAICWPLTCKGWLCVTLRALLLQIRLLAATQLFHAWWLRLGLIVLYCWLSWERVKLLRGKLLWFGVCCVCALFSLNKTCLMATGHVCVWGSLLLVLYRVRPLVWKSLHLTKSSDVLARTKTIYLIFQFALWLSKSRLSFT